MIKLLKIEYKKAVYNKTFWVLFGLYALIIAIIYWGIQSFLDDIVEDIGKNAPIPVTNIPIYEFPSIWHNLTFISGYLKLILSIIVVILISNEYSFRTVRQNIITGLSRVEFLTSKLLFIICISGIATLFIFLNGLILGFINTSDISFGIIFQKAHFLLGYFLELISFMTFAMMLTFLIRKSGLTLGILLLYYYLVEPFLNYKLPNDIGSYLPLQQIAHLIDMPSSTLTDFLKAAGMNINENIELVSVIIIIGYSVLFTYCSYLVLRKRDL